MNDTFTPKPFSPPLPGEPPKPLPMWAATQKLPVPTARGEEGGVEFEVIRGASGRWVAREVLGRFVNGRPSKFGRKFVGHVPRKLDGKDADDVIIRQIKWQAAGGPTPSVTPPNGGGKWTLFVDIPAPNTSEPSATVPTAPTDTATPRETPTTAPTETPPPTDTPAPAPEGPEMPATGREIINVTPHPITFADGDGVIVIPPCGTVISATPEETEVPSPFPGVTLVRTAFVPNDEAVAALDSLEAAHPGAIIVGSIIAAQAFPGRVLAMVPAPGFERVPPAEKRMRLDKFTTF